jgi:hypothetical protein
VHPAVRATSSVQVKTCGRILPAVLDQQISEFSFEIHSRIFFEHLLDQSGRYLIKAKPKKSSPAPKWIKAISPANRVGIPGEVCNAIACQIRSARSCDT